MKSHFLTLCLALAACSGSQGNGSADIALNDSEPENGAVANVAVTADWPADLKPFGDGYPNPGDTCRRLGESAATSNYLDDSADLVGCPTAEAAAALGGKIVGKVGGITMVSVPRGDVNRGAATSAETSRPKIRGKGGLEEQCMAKVADITRARVIGVNRIDESKKPIEIYVNVEGAQAPWRCFVNRNGTLGDAEFSGDEGRL